MHFDFRAPKGLQITLSFLRFLFTISIIIIIIILILILILILIMIMMMMMMMMMMIRHCPDVNPMTLSVIIF